MGTYAEGEAEPVAPLPGQVTDQEIMRQKLEQISADLASMRRDRRGTDKTLYERYGGAINVVLGALLSIATVVVGATIKRQNDVEETANKAQSGVERIDKDRTARLAGLDRWTESVETELRTYRVSNAEFQQMKGVVGKLGEQLATGREERLKDRETDRQEAQRSREAILAAIGDLKTQVALLRQSMGAPGRNPENPFGGGENQMWIPPLLNPEADRPLILKATLSRPFRVGVRRGGKRRAVVAVSLTRSLERAFGRPHFRGRYWASLRWPTSSGLKER